MTGAFLVDRLSAIGSERDQLADRPPFAAGLDGAVS